MRTNIDMLRKFEIGDEVVVKNSVVRKLVGHLAEVVEFDGDYLVRFDFPYSNQLHDNGGYYADKLYWWFAPSSLTLRD